MGLIRIAAGLLALLQPIHLIGDLQAQRWSLAVLHSLIFFVLSFLALAGRLPLTRRPRRP